METRKVAAKNIPSDISAPKNAGQAEKAEKTGTASPSTQALDPGRGAAGKPGINVALSPKARELADARKKAFDIAKATPDIREDRVAELKRQIQAGQYQVDPGKIADGIAREALLEYLAESDGKPGI